MKKVFLSIIAAAAMFVGCNADADVEVIRPIKVDAPTFSASFDAETRTSYEENQGYAKWIENEHLSIFNLDNHNLKYYIHNVGNNGKTADMDYAEEYVEKSGDILDQNYAIYPYSEVNEAANGVIYSEIPAVQTYNAESNFKNVPIVACSPDTSLSFSIPTAIYRYKVKKQNHPSKFYLKSITMTSKSKNIAGAIEIDMTAEKPVAVVTGDGKSVTLDLGENGVEITTTEQDFYIALPAISFPENDRTITCLVSKGGKDYQVVIEKDKTMELEAGIVKSTSIELKATSFTANSVYPSTGGELVGNLTLTSDFNLTQPLTVPTGEEATLNLNGHNITNKVENTATDVIIVEEGATLTINGNGNVTAVSGNDGYPIVCYGELIINDGVFTSGIDAAGATNACIYAKTNGKITINGGEFKSADGSFVLNLHDGSHATASIIVKGGKFHNFDPANNKSEKPAQSFVAEGYISVETSEGVWEVFPANEPVEVATAAALEDVLAQGGKATLTNDISLENTAIVITEGEATIDLNGKTITGGLFAESNGAVTEGTTDSYAFWVKEGAKLTINGDGKVKTDACKYSMAVWAQGGEVIINGGYYENAGEGSDLIYASAGGKIIINGGEFKACPKQPGVEGTAEKYSALNLKDKTGSQIIVYGGKFHNFDPANNTSEGAGTSFVAEGYISVETSEGVWEVLPATESIEVASAAALEDVLAQGGKATLAADIDLENTAIAITEGEATIDLNGKNITGGLFAESNGAVTEGTTDSYAFWVKDGAKLTINGDGKVKTDACKYSMAVWAQGGEVIINGGYYENAGEGSDLIYASAGGKIIINGGEFKACPKQTGVEGTAEEYSALNLKDNTGSQIIVYGGKFHNFDPANNKSENPAQSFVAEGYISVETSEGVWEVLPATESVKVASAAALEDVLAQGGKATLTNDINLENTAIVITEGEATIDLNGKTITGGLFTESNGAVTEGTTDSYVFWVKGGTLNIKGDGTVKSQSATYSIAVWADGGTVNIENGKFYNEGHGSDLIYAKNNGIVNIYGGYFEACKSDHTEDGTQEDYSALNLHGTYPGTITVYGGQFFGFDPANNASENPKISFVAEGYISVETSENVWEVFPATESIEVASAAALEDVLAQGGEATLTADINLENTAIVITEGEATIKLNGKTITGGLFAESSGAITEGNSDSYAFWVKGGTLNIKGDGNVKSQFATYSMAVWADGGSVNIYGGNFYNYGHGCDLIYAKNGGIVNIYGGYFEACKSDHTEDGTLEEYSALNLHGTYPGTITVYGGKFYKFDPANNKSENPAQSFVAEGKTSTQSGDYFIVQ